MLQTRFETEQFDTLPLIFPSHRSRNDYITTDRPDSAQLVDLHIYIIPKSIWKNVQHLAQNQAMDDAISAGFVRVSPEKKLRDLRGSIENLCGKENYFPREFIFLRSVGRCLTRVKQSQEIELKVKNYRPPQTLASEIYLLEGRHEDYGNISSASPALSSASYLFGSRRQFRYNFDDLHEDPSKSSHRKPLRAEREELPMLTRDHITYRRSSSKRKTASQSDLDDSFPNASISTGVTVKELNKLKEEQERLRRRQEELERMRQAAEEKKVQLQRERLREEQERLEREQKERERRRDEKEQLQREEKERFEREVKEQLERERHEHAVERRRQRRQEKAEIERQRVEKLELAATKIQASFRGFQDRQRFRDRQRNSEILSRTSIGSTSGMDSSLSRPETRTIKRKSSDNLRSSSSSFLSKENDRTFRLKRTFRHAKTEDLSMMDDFHLEERIRAATVTKIRHSDEEILPISTSEDETYEIERREGDIKRQMENEKRKKKDLEDRQRRELEKFKQREDVESLRARLEKLRSERIQQERFRDEVIKQLRHVHQRITQRRKEARSMWKKKYFQEKKKTSPLEDRVAQLKSDVEFHHSKTIQIIESESKHAAQVGAVKEAEIETLLVQITRTRHELANVRRQVDVAKLRLTTDIKLRNQAENESGLLKHELTQARMNLNHIKNRQTV